MSVYQEMMTLMVSQTQSPTKSNTSACCGERNPVEQALQRRKTAWNGQGSGQSDKPFKEMEIGYSDDR